MLCESLPDKVRLFGEFSEEVIQAESRIGAIYLREGECLNAAEHLKIVWSPIIFFVRISKCASLLLVSGLAGIRLWPERSSHGSNAQFRWVSKKVIFDFQSLDRATSSVFSLFRDPMVSRTFFARTEDGKRQDRPAFRTNSRISHEKQDLQLFQAVSRKPPVNPKAWLRISLKLGLYFFMLYHTKHHHWISVIFSSINKLLTGNCSLPLIKSAQDTEIICRF